MDRRELMAVVGSLAIGAFTAPVRAAGSIEYWGALPPIPRIVIPRRFHTVYRPMRGFAKELAQTGRDVLLYQYLAQEIGEIEPHWQGPDPETGNEGEGDCVAHSGAMGCDVLAASNIHRLRLPEKWVAKASVEMLYAGGRVEIGNGVIGDRGGSRGEWQARFLRDYGVLHRVEYTDDSNTVDLSGYDPGRSRQYRSVGVPNWLEPIARIHPVREATGVSSGREILDAIAANQPVILCSSYKVENQRDSAGFSRLYTGRFRPQSWHAMVATGAVLTGDRIGAIVQNSWGDWNVGPRPHDMPRGSFLLDEDALDLMARDWGDCWALGSYYGHQSEEIKRRIHRLWR